MLGFIMSSSLRTGAASNLHCNSEINISRYIKNSKFYKQRVLRQIKINEKQKRKHIIKYDMQTATRPETDSSASKDTTCRLKKRHNMECPYCIRKEWKDDCIHCHYCHVKLIILAKEPINRKIRTSDIYTLQQNR